VLCRRAAAAIRTVLTLCAGGGKRIYISGRREEEPQLPIIMPVLSTNNDSAVYRKTYNAGTSNLHLGKFGH
jgi:hypothetical protein